MPQTEIEQAKEGVYRTVRHTMSDITEIQTGVLLKMKDGSQWFHPYSGAAPRKETGE